MQATRECFSSGFFCFLVSYVERVLVMSQKLNSIQVIGHIVDSGLKASCIRQQYKAVFAALVRIVDEHKKLEKENNRIIGERQYLENQLGKVSGTVDRQGVCSKLDPIDAGLCLTERVAQLKRYCIDYNQRLSMLTQVTREWATLRQKLLSESVPNTHYQRFRDLLLASECTSLWNGRLVKANHYLNSINAEFVGKLFEYGDKNNHKHLMKALRFTTVKSDRKAHKRLSRRAGQGYAKIADYDNRYSEFSECKVTSPGQLMKGQRIGLVMNTLSRNKARFRRVYKAAYWTSEDTLRNFNANKLFALVLWLKRNPELQQYKAVDKLNRLYAANNNPSVNTICTSSPELIGNVSVQSVSVPVYRSQCLVVCVAGESWRDSGKLTFQTERNDCVFFGKTSIPALDERLARVDWLHIAPDETDTIYSTNERILASLTQRIAYIRNQFELESEKRKRIATYCRKLVRLERMTMFDSKSAGNCLPGTLLWCKEFGVELPAEDWCEHSVDARQLLRTWKAKEYGGNTLFLKAIDTAYKALQAKITSCGVVTPVPAS